ncbi:MAG: Nif3-like dinuclear metal center hexameric protein, partial [Actinomycetia bacterium]|nr:Nif3-like dinuclear metal center hexameric protein [Actinomycetes bacterium]
MLTKILNIFSLRNDWAPFNLALDWDNVGLQVGNLEEEVSKILISLDLTYDVLNQAKSNSCGLIITHHPLIFEPVKSIHSASILAEVIKAKISVITMHTNLDQVENGVSDILAKKLGIIETVPIVSAKLNNIYKLVTFVPPDHLERVRDELQKHGAGKIGNYRGCSFQVTGTGTFIPEEDAEPYSGEIGRINKVEEIRLEINVPKDKLDKIIKKLMDVHPYEEVAYDIYRTEQVFNNTGLGRIGNLEKKIPVKE